MKQNELSDYLFILYCDNKLSHAYLIETNNYDKCIDSIKRFIKMTVCQNKYNDNCDKCSLCHLIDIDSIPSINIIKPDGKSINKESIDMLKEKFAYHSAYTDNRFYIISEAEKMNDTAYNRLLKFLEEPEDNIIGFYLCQDIDKIPSTIISRLSQIKYYYEGIEDENVLLKQEARNYLKLLVEDNKNVIWYNNNVIQKQFDKREEMISFFREMLKQTLKNNQIELAQIIKKYLLKLEYNVNLSMLLDSFVIEVGDLYENI